MTRAIPIDVSTKGDDLLEGGVDIATDHRIFDPADDFAIADAIT